MQGVVAPTMVQLNVRLSQASRQAGDKVLSEHGLAPSEVIRSLWEKLSLGGKEADEVLSLVMGKPDDPSRQDRIDQRLAALARGSRMFSDFAAREGLELSTHVTLSDEELDEARWQDFVERFGA